LFCNPSPRYCAPWIPIWFAERENSMSVCIKWEKSNIKRLFLSHCIVWQPLSKILRTIISNSIVMKVKFGEFLYKIKEYSKSKYIFSHCVILQFFTKILCTFISNLIFMEVKSRECLYKI
jgi:hypothetical protein